MIWCVICVAAVYVHCLFVFVFLLIQVKTPKDEKYGMANHEYQQCEEKRVVPVLIFGKVDAT